VHLHLVAACNTIYGLRAVPAMRSSLLQFSLRLIGDILAREFVTNDHNHFDTAFVRAASFLAIILLKFFGATTVKKYIELCI
jgi:hypothetical protein